MKVGDRIRTKRIDLGLSVDELATRLGKNRATIYRYEKGDIENLPVSVLEPLAEALQTTPEYLMGWAADTKKAPAVTNHEGGVPEWKKKLGATPCNTAQVAPLLGTVRAGLPMYADENVEGYIPIRQSDGAEYFWLNVRGDSMNAAGLDDGDQILVRVQPEVENGEIAVVLVNGDEATVKTFRQEGDLVILTPRSTNPVHQPQVYDLKKTPIRVLGLVIESRKTFNRC